MTVKRPLLAPGIQTHDSLFLALPSKQDLHLSDQSFSSRLYPLIYWASTETTALVTGNEDNNKSPFGTQLKVNRKNVLKVAQGIPYKQQPRSKTVVVWVF